MNKQKAKLMLELLLALLLVSSVLSATINYALEVKYQSLLTLRKFFLLNEMRNLLQVCRFTDKRQTQQSILAAWQARHQQLLQQYPMQIDCDLPAVSIKTAEINLRLSPGAVHAAE